MYIRWQVGISRTLSFVWTKQTIFAIELSFVLQSRERTLLFEYLINVEEFYITYENTSNT